MLSYDLDVHCDVGAMNHSLDNAQSPLHNFNVCMGGLITLIRIMDLCRLS